MKIKTKQDIFKEVYGFGPKTLYCYDCLAKRPEASHLATVVYVCPYCGSERESVEIEEMRELKIKRLIG